MANERPNECATVSDTTSRLGRPNMTSPNPARQGKEDAHDAGGRRNNVATRSVPALGLKRRLEDGGDAESPYLPADLAALVADLAAEGEDVARDHARPGAAHVAFDRDEVAEQLAVDVGRALHHEQMPRDALGGPDAEVAQPGSPAGDVQAHARRCAAGAPSGAAASMAVGLLEIVQVMTGVPAGAGAMA